VTALHLRSDRRRLVFDRRTPLGSGLQARSQSPAPAPHRAPSRLGAARLLTDPARGAVGSSSQARGPFTRQAVLLYVAIALILLGTVGTIIEIVPQIEALLLALAGRGYLYLALGVAGGLLLYYARRKESKQPPGPDSAR
jgi:hypothetical protein